MQSAILNYTVVLKVLGSKHLYSATVRVI